ncbi:hypothetical protein GCM10009802_17790 [Streptomyces synnematoformans]|uniref:Uncharacterized protein n=1 Tax=Streptomyces synnematoformans TaxID=415721 RepID=A0ABN2XUI5_9ACTN
MDQWDIIGRSHGREEGKAHGDPASVDTVPDKPPARLENTVSVSPPGRRRDVLVFVNRDVEVVESVGEVAGAGRRPGQVSVQDGRHVPPDSAPVFRAPGARPSTVRPIFWIRFSVARKRLVWRGLV